MSKDTANECGLSGRAGAQVCLTSQGPLQWGSSPPQVLGQPPTHCNSQHLGPVVWGSQRVVVGGELGDVVIGIRSWITTSAVELNFSGVLSTIEGWGREKEDLSGWQLLYLSHPVSGITPAPTCLFPPIFSAASQLFHRHLQGHLSKHHPPPRPPPATDHNAWFLIVAICIGTSFFLLHWFIMCIIIFCFQFKAILLL